MRKFLVGKRISLHGLTREQIQTDTPYYHWLDNLGLDLFGERSDFPNNIQRMNAYYETACESRRLVHLGIFNNEDDKHIGNITLQEIDWVHRRAYLGYLVGEVEFSGRGIATDGFNKLNLARIWTFISSGNGASLRVAEKAGLKQEGLLRGHSLRKGQRLDSIVVGVLRDEWMNECGERALALFAEPPV
jgi:[ribosomal protein S5]-alanine N-acetyltransferase